MKKITIILLIFITNISFSEVTTANKIKNLSLKKAQEITLENNFDLKAMLTNIKAAKARLKQVFSEYLPTLSLYASYNKMDISIQPDHNPYIRAEDKYNEFTKGVQISWLVFDGFARKAANEVANSSHNASILATTNMKRILLQCVTKAFYQAQLAKEHMYIAKQDEEFNIRLKIDAQKRFQVGTLPESEVLNFSVRALNAKNLYQQSKTNFKLASIVLRQLMSLDDNAISIDVISEHNNLIVKKYIINQENEIDFALKNRSDIKILDEQIKGLNQRLKIVTSEYYPVVALIASNEETDRRKIVPVNFDNDISFIGLKANWKLYNGGKTKAKIKEVMANIDGLLEKKKSLKLKIKSSINQNFANLNLAYNNFLIQKEILEMTLKIRDHVEKSYKIGTMNLTRLNETQTDFVKSKSSLISSIIQYKLMVENLNIETGKIFANDN